MKTRIFTFGIKLFLFAFLANFSFLQAQIPAGGIVKDSIYVWDDFLIEGDVLTNDNGTTGSGWTDNWTYQTGVTSGVTVNNGSITGIAGGFGINRDLINSIPLGTSTFYLAFVVNKTPTGDFRIAGNRADGIERYAVGVRANGGLFGNIANTQITGDPGVVQNNTTYLMVAKWSYSGKGLMDIAAYKASETIPTEEPAAGEWDFENAGGVTGVPIDYFRIFFASESVTLHDFKVGDSWKSVIGDTLLILPSNLEIMAISSTTAKLTWSDNSFYEDGFKIYLNGAEVGSVGANVSEFEVTGLTDGTSYTFGVSAYNGTVETAKGELTDLFELDLTPPTVLQTLPENNATDIDETSDIVIKFSEIMNTTSVEGAITINPALTNAQYAWKGDTILTISADDLANSTLYTVTIGTGASDLSGNSLAEAYVTSFTTIEKDITPPTIVGSSPTDNATNVLIASNIEIAFSEAMNKPSVEGAITVAPVLTDISYTWLSDTLLKVSHVGYLTGSTEYIVTIATAASDIKGNGLAAQEVINFTTSSTTLLHQDDFSIPDGQYTNRNGTSGQGWNGPWTYETAGFLGGNVYAINEYMSGSNVAHIIRKINQPFGVSSTDFYMSFLAYRTPEGSFDVLGGRKDPTGAMYRTGVGVSQEGSLRFRMTSGQVQTSTTTGQFEAGTTYLVVFKNTGQQSTKVKLFKLGDNVVEPADGAWDFEVPQGATGIVMDCIGLLVRTAGVNIDDLKVGNTWADIANTTIKDLSEFPVIRPGNIFVNANSPSSAEVRWTDNCLAEEGFRIYLNEIEVGTVGENENLFEVSDLTEGETYIISVSAFKGDTEDISDTLSYTFTFDAANYVDTDIEIAKAPSTPVIDGVVDNIWNEYAFKNPVKRFNPTNEAAPEDDADYHATWSAMWDNNNIYFLFEVTDQTLVFNDGSGTNIGQDDGFDWPIAKGSDEVWAMNRLNLIAPPESDTTLYIHEGMPAVKNAEKAFTLTENGYIIELSIVLRDFDESIGLFVEGYKFMMDARYNDDDTQANRDAQYSWTDKNVPGWTWNNINSLGSVSLVETVDIISPTITQTSPADGSSNVVVNADIVITFSEAMNKASVEKSVAAEPALANAQYTWDGDTKVTISADNLDANTEYTVTIGVGALDLHGNWMPEPYSFNFTTGLDISVGEDLVQKLKVYTTENGSFLHIENYDGPAVIYNITGRHVMNIKYTTEPVNISGLNRGIYIVRTDKGTVKFLR